MALLYVNRARNNSSGAYVYWVTEDAADSGMSSSGAPSSSSHSDPVVAGIRVARGNKTADLSAQITGSNSAFTVSESYVASTLEVFYNGQFLKSSSITTTSTTFTLDFTPQTSGAIIISYRPA